MKTQTGITITRTEDEIRFSRNESLVCLVRGSEYPLLKCEGTQAAGIIADISSLLGLYSDKNILRLYDMSPEDIGTLLDLDSRTIDRELDFILNFVSSQGAIVCRAGDDSLKASLKQRTLDLARTQIRTLFGTRT